jgi:hypothetical protein
MARTLDDLNEEERVDAALAILALDFVGQISRVEKELDLESKTVKQIKKKALDAINRAFSDEEEPELTFEISIKEGLARIKKSESSKSKGVGKKRRSSESANLSEEQRAKLDEALEVIKDYNDLPDKEREIKRKYKITADNLNAIAGFDRSIAGAWLEENETKVADFNEDVDQYRKENKPQGEKGKDSTEPLKSFYTKQGEAQSEELVSTTGGKSKSKK